MLEFDELALSMVNGPRQCNTFEKRVRMLSEKRDFSTDLDDPNNFTFSNNFLAAPTITFFEDTHTHTSNNVITTQYS